MTPEAALTHVLSTVLVAGADSPYRLALMAAGVTTITDLLSLFCSY
jgi:hypothetical protein